MKTLRPYQEASIKGLFAYLFNKQGHPLVVAPVGAGKSLMIAEFIRRVHSEWPKTRIVMLTHVKELLQQNAEELREQYPSADMGFYCAGLGQKRLHNDITFASIQSVHSKVGNFNRCPEIIIIDECHLISHNDQTLYRKFIDAVLSINPNCKVIGFTGTPFRSDTGRLDEGEGRLFDDVAYEIPMTFMINEGYWTNPVTPQTGYTMDVKGVGTRGGDYITSQLEKAVDVDEVTRACIDRTVMQAENRKKVLVFTAGIQHCEHVRDYIRSIGETAEMVTGKTPDDERKRIIQDFRSGKFKYLINVAVLTTGFNVPDIDCLVFMRPTRSPVLYIQCVGRGVRTVYPANAPLDTKEQRLAAIEASDKKDCLVLDFGGVVETLGPIDEVEIRKKFDGREKEGAGDGASFKICPSCGAECAPAQRYCYSCSYSFVTESLNANASNKAIVSTDQEPVEYDVIGVATRIHRKRDSGPQDPRTLCVSYVTMSGHFSEYIGFEHHKFEPEDNRRYAWEKAVQWWKDNTDGDLCKDRFEAGDYVRMGVPNNCEDAKKFEHTIKKPSQILVRKKGKFFEIIDKIYAQSIVIEHLELNEIPF